MTINSPIFLFVFVSSLWILPFSVFFKKTSSLMLDVENPRRSNDQGLVMFFIKYFSLLVFTLGVFALMSSPMGDYNVSRNSFFGMLIIFLIVLGKK